MTFGILGPLTVTVGADDVDLGPAKQRALLAILLCRANSVVPTELLRAALDLWRGPALAEFSANPVPQREAGRLASSKRTRTSSKPGESHERAWELLGVSRPTEFGTTD